MAQPPRLARWLLMRALTGDARECIVGDVDEEYAVRRSAGTVRARIWYWSQALRSVRETRTQESYLMTDSREAHTSTSTLRQVAALGRDVRYAVRGLRRTPGFTVTALVTLGLGVGGATAIFSAVNDALLRPLPYQDPGRLVALGESNEARGWHHVEAAPANMFDWRERANSFDDIAFINPFAQSISLVGDTGPVPADVAEVSGNFFSVLGVAPLMGRTFTDAETFTPGITMLSFRTWQLQFGSDPGIIGRIIRLDGGPHEVIGVMGAEFRYPFGSADVWTTPARMASRRQSIWWRQAHVIRPIGRLRHGVAPETAAAELAGISAHLEAEHPDTNTGMEAVLIPLHDYLSGDRRSTLLLLLGAVGILQLIACANVAHLMLGRGLARRREWAVRAALGAGRGRLVGQMFVDSLTLSVGGTLLGLGLGWAGLSVLAASRVSQVGATSFQLDWRLFLFSAGICVLSAVLAGLWPAWRASKVNPAGSFHLGSRGQSGGSGRLAAANLFVVFEIAMAVVLVAAAGLLVRSLDQLRRVPIGADLTNVLTFRVRPSSGVFPTGDARVRFAEDLSARLDALPGVASSGVGRGVPLSGYGWTSSFTIDGWGPDRFGEDVALREATTGYFLTLQIPLLGGRLFEAADLADGARIPVVVNQAFVDRYFPGSSPVGRLVTLNRQPTEQSTWLPIVGVVGNERRTLHTPPVPEIIVHLAGNIPATLTFVVKTAVAPLSLIPEIRTVLADIDPEAPLLAPRTMEQVANDARASDRFVATLFGAFAVAALLLAAVGVYGVAHQAASARTREVGIRLALGAPGATVVRQLVVRGLLFCAAGLTAGTAAVLLTGSIIESRLFEVEPTDPATLITVVLVIGLVGLLAIVWPTWRATRVDPVSVLRID